MQQSTLRIWFAVVAIAILALVVPSIYYAQQGYRFQEQFMTSIAGKPGATGLPGPPGPQGGDGETGAPGPPGPDGGTGGTGTPGTDGGTGDDGSTGVQGAKGQPGDTGQSGGTGIKGSTGETGIPGSTGTQGSSGGTGTTGNTGTTGSSGTQGSNGDSGSYVTNPVYYNVAAMKPYLITPMPTGGQGYADTLSSYVNTGSGDYVLQATGTSSSIGPQTLGLHHPLRFNLRDFYTNTQINITVDLGAVYPIFNAMLGGVAYIDYAIDYPGGIFLSCSNSSSSGFIDLRGRASYTRPSPTIRVGFFTMISLPGGQAARYWRFTFWTRTYEWNGFTTVQLFTQTNPTAPF